MFNKGANCSENMLQFFQKGKNKPCNSGQIEQQKFVLRPNMTISICMVTIEAGGYYTLSKEATVTWTCFVQLFIFPHGKKHQQNVPRSICTSCWLIT
jgi:hypothetical protein